MYKEIVKNISKEIMSILGGGYKEHIYQKAICTELMLRNIVHNTEVIIPIVYKQHSLGFGRADIIIDNQMILELKAVSSSPGDLEKQQLINYMNMSGIRTGYVINFNRVKQEPEFIYVSMPTDLGAPSALSFASSDPVNTDPNKLITINDINTMIL